MARRLHLILATMRVSASIDFGRIAHHTAPGESNRSPGALFSEVDMTIERVTDMKHRIISDSGKIYTVQETADPDGYDENVHLWACTCPAYRFNGGNLCKHINAVIALNRRSV